MASVATVVVMQGLRLEVRAEGTGHAKLYIKNVRFFYISGSTETEFSPGDNPTIGAGGKVRIKYDVEVRGTYGMGTIRVKAQGGISNPLTYFGSGETNHQMEAGQADLTNMYLDLDATAQITESGSFGGWAKLMYARGTNTVWKTALSASVVWTPN